MSVDLYVTPLLGPPEPAITYGMPEDVYRKLPGNGSTDIKRLLRSAAHYEDALHRPSESTDAQQLGTAVHLAVLEPARFEGKVVVEPDLDRRTKVGKEAAAAFAAAHAGKLILSLQDYETTRRIADSVRRHPGAAFLLQDGASEVTLQWTDEASGAPCKARLDWLAASMVVVDLKTTRDASPAGFSRAIGTYGYAIQAAHYRNGFRVVMGQDMPAWVFIAVEKEPPYAVGVYALETESIDAAAERVAGALHRYKVCMETGEWPAYSSLIEPIKTPNWAL
jgi:hypothetical protein